MTRALTAAVLITLGVPWARAADVAATPLDHYLDGLKSLRAEFTQTVTDAHGTQTEAGRGTLEVQRPGRFRWDYQPQAAANAAGTPPSPPADADSASGGQLLVADGKNLWFYDRELEQVSIKPYSAALSATPVMLLSGSAAQLHASFDLKDEGSHDGLRWVGVQPKAAEADFSHAELGFAGDQLARMQVDDRLGQKVQLQFTHSERNGSIDAAHFTFRAPAGVDVIGTPQ